MEGVESRAALPRIRLVKFILFLEILVFSIFSFLNYVIYDLADLARIEFVFLLLCAFTLIGFIRTNRLQRTIWLTVLITGMILLLYTWSVQARFNALVWAAVFPVVCFFLLGARRGLVAYAIFSALLVALMVHGTLHWTHISGTENLINSVAALLVLGGCMFVNEWNREQQFAQSVAVSRLDPLTCTWNLTMLDGLLQREIERSSSRGRDLVLILADIDLFEQVNTRFGRQTGDTALVRFCELIEQSVGETDHLVRAEGDAFLILCPGRTIEEGLDLAESLRSTVASADFGTIGTLTATFGVAAWRAGESDQDLLQRIGEVVYQAKIDGRDRVSG